MKLVTPVLLALLAGAGSAQIPWTSTFEAARKKSQAEKKVLFVAMHLDRHRDCDEIAATHYRDRAIGKLAAHTVNLFCSNDVHKRSGRCPVCKSGKCATHATNDQMVRKELLQLEDGGPLQPPLHVFFAPDGKVLTSTKGFLTAGELEWMFVDAIRELDPTFAWTPTGRSRAPEQLQRGSASTDKLTAKPPTKAQVDQALKDIKKLDGGRGGILKILQNARKNSRLIIRSDDKRALDWGQSTLRAYRQFRIALLRDMGRLSPKPWGKVVSEWLDTDSAETRKTAAIALALLRDKKAATALRKAIRKEDELDILGRMLRALAVCAPTNGSAISTITNTLKKHDDPTVRAHAVVAVGKLEKREPITAGLKLALQDPDATVRAVAAYVIAIRQDREMMQHLSSSAAAESDATAKKWMDHAITAVKDGDTTPFKGFREAILDGGDTGDALERLEKLVEEFTKEPPANKGEGKSDEGKSSDEKKGK